MRKSRGDTFYGRVLSMIGKTAVCILIFWILFRRIEMSDVIETILRTEISLVMFAVGLSLAGLLLGAYRWQISLSVQRLPVPFVVVLNATLVSRFLGLIMPAFIGSDAIRGYDMFRHIKAGTNIFASILFERICGLMSMVAVGSCALFIGIKETGNTSLVTPFIIVYFVLFLLILGCFCRPIAKRAISLFAIIPRSNWIKEKVEGISEAIYQYRRYPRVWGRVLGLSLLYQFLGVFFYYVISLSLSLDIPLITFFVLIPIINLVSMTPISPGGLGVKEGMFVLLFYQYGVTPVESLLISLIGTAVFAAITLIGGIVYLIRPRVESVPYNYSN